MPVSYPSRPSSAFHFIFTLIAAMVFALALCAPMPGQETAQAAAVHPPLITQLVDESQLTTLMGNTHPMARPRFDLGTAPASLPMARMLLVLKRSADQETALRQLLDDQQNKASANYHKWLTPEQYGQQFGPTDTDLQTITAWLQSHGFQVGSSKGRTVLEFSGTAGQVQEAFHTAIHKYVVNGEQHWANASDPMIPTALTPAVAGMASLNNFPRKAMNVPGGVGERDPKTGKIHPSQPLLTFPSGCVENNTISDYCNNWLGPYDFATIYDVLPLWNAGIDGTGVSIAIVGETDIQMSDVQAFRSFFGLPVNDPVFIWNGSDPGIQGDESEADIDVQWSGAVAKGATIDFVISQSTETTSGTDLSAVYIVENNLAAVMSESYGECELGLGTTGNQFYNTLWQQASAQGITVLISAGDGGSAGCDNFDAGSPAPAQYGLQVSGYASTPYNVAVGGTDFNDFNNPGSYWSTTNNPTTQESALKYIPESTWNDSCTNALWEMFPQLSTNPETNCNNPNLNDVIIVAGSGGVSKCTTPSGSTPSSCAGGYARPSWQTGSGSFSTDGKRDIPDVSLFASNGFVGHAYVVCQADAQGACPSSFLGYGGTSVSSPAFAGIMALVNQQTGERQGNANYVLYTLAAQQPSAFHDVTVGTNAVPCVTGSPNCTTTIAGDSYGILSGYNAAAGYNLATGLGSVDANNLVTKWNSVTLLPSATTLSSLTPTTITHGQAVNFTVSVAPKSGTGTPTGSISLEGGPTSSTGAIAGFSLTNGSVSGSTETLPGGTYSVTAHYPGDSTYGASDSGPISVTVNKENSLPQVFLATFNSTGSVLSSNTNTTTYGSPYVLRVNVDNAAGQLCAPVVTSGATACPTGSVTLTDNGSALDAGTFALNSYGYFEDLAVQLPGGTNSVKATYAGDDSFNSSVITTPIVIVPAPTTTQYTNAGTVYAGQPASLITLVQTQSSGVAPTGTVTFSVNGSPLTGTLTLQGTAGSASNPAMLYADLSNVIFTAVGSVAVTAAYSGDANYVPSSSSTNVIVTGQATNTIMASPMNPQPGASVTLTAVIDTSVKSPAPSGVVVFYDSTDATVGSQQIAGNVTYLKTTDMSGNAELQATITFVPPTITTGVQAYYTNDPFFPQGFSNGVNIVLAGNDFGMYPTVSVASAPAQGQDAFEGINIYGETNYTGTINFTGASCTGLPAETTCSFSPASITGTGSTTITLQTTAPTAQAKRTIQSKSSLWMAMGPLVVGGLFMLFGPSKRNRAAGVVGLMLLGLLIILPSCGGGNSGGGSSGGGNPGTPIGSYTVTVAATSGSLSHSTSFTLLVQ